MYVALSFNYFLVILHCNSVTWLMNRYILSLFFALSLSVGASFFNEANAAIEVIDNDFQQVSIVLMNDNSLRVSNANGQRMYIYNVAGILKKTILIEGQERTYDLNLPKGCYIVQVGKTVRKISIR